MPTPRRRRNGATLAETALVLSMTLTLLIGIILGGIAISRYQTVVVLAQEATRAGAVRGAKFREKNGLTVGSTSDWAADLYSSGQARFPTTGLVDVSDLGLDPANLRYTCTWSNNSNEPLRVISDNGQAVNNTLRVTVEYDWLGGFFPALTFRASSEMPITF